MGNAGFDILGIESPDGKHIFNLVFEGEIRFGPAYFKAILDSKAIESRIFGREYLWDKSSEFLALQEWLTISEKEGPNTALFIYDIRNNRFARISTAEGGFITPLKFENKKIIYKKEFLGRTLEYEILLESINNWDNQQSTISN